MMHQTNPDLTPLPTSVLQQTVFLGDSITDGNTYPMLVRDALLGAGVQVTAINAGIGGDTAGGMLARLDRDVLAHAPTLVTFMSGGNDAAQGILQETYAANVRAIIERLQELQIPLILLTPLCFPRKQASKMPLVEQYLRAIRHLAGEYHLRLAEVNDRMHEAAGTGDLLFAPDGHPNYSGQRMIARAVLDAMGYADVPVPARAEHALQPGVIARWQFRPVAPGEEALTPEAVAAQIPVAEWVTLTLPDTEPLTADEDLWLDDYRRQGMAVRLNALVGGETGKFIGVATIDSQERSEVNFHTGGTLMTVWLNGSLIYHNDWQHGWHVGRESVIAELHSGRNRVVIETGEQFFLSVTGESYWR